MQKYIFGFDADHPENCARRLRAQGIDAVIIGDADDRTEDALANAGLELYLCFGAHGLSSNAPSTAQNAAGRPVRWFSSGCPNDSKNTGRHQQDVLRRAKKLKTLRGILVDGARFASFASAEGGDVFFTCFCPNCMKKMDKLGLDAKSIRASVARLSATRKLFDRDRENLTAWMNFRASCVRDTLDRFTESVHALRSDLLAGAFVFAPSLAPFVGQTPEACRSLDVVAPMLYRAYPHADGPACLGHEWAGLKALFSESAEEFVRLVSPEEILPDETPAALIETGFPPERVAGEVIRARRALQTGQKLWPILQIEDAFLPETTRLALESGADAAGYFMFGQADLP